MYEETPASGSAPIQEVPEKTLYLGKWSTRFWAWLIDFILVILFLNIVRGIFQPFWIIPFYIDFRRWEPFEFGFQTLFFFAYWTVMEGFRGQSIGKMVMNLRVVNGTVQRSNIQQLPSRVLAKRFSFLLTA
jgi:uncharacterized RDD family membrane protein YckC